MTQAIEPHPLSKTIHICHGKACRKSKEKHQQLCAQFPNATPIKCIGVCKGPVVLITEGLKTPKQTVFQKIRKAETQLKLERFIRWGELSPTLQKKQLGVKKLQKLGKKIQKRLG